METVVRGMQIARPKLEMVVPYKQYKLVRGDGSAPERTKKHPFCMSRVHYSAPGHSASLHKNRGACLHVWLAPKYAVLMLQEPHLATDHAFR